MNKNTEIKPKFIGEPINSNPTEDISVIRNKRIGLGIKYFGIGFFIFLSLLGVLLFISFNYDGLLTTTYLTLILISFAFVTKIENAYLNSMLTLTFYGFFSLCLWLIPVIDTLIKFFVGFLLHLSISLFQLFLIISPKIKCSKHAYYWGALFYMCWNWVYDDLFRLNEMTGVDHIFPAIATQIHSFYTLFISLWILIYIKKRRGLLVP